MIPSALHRCFGTAFGLVDRRPLPSASKACNCSSAQVDVLTQHNDVAKRAQTSARPR